MCVEHVYITVFVLDLGVCLPNSNLVIGNKTIILHYR